MKINPSVVLAILLTYLLFYGTAVLSIPPYTTLIERPVVAAKALIAKRIIEKKDYPSVYWGIPRDDRKGLVTHKWKKAFNGFTFFSSSKDQSAYLVNMKGDIVHQWDLSYKDIWPAPSHVAAIVPENKRIISRAQLYPNGDMLAIYTGIGSAPLGYGLAKVDKDSKLLWSYDDAIHHDVEIDTDGTIYTLSHHLRHTHFDGLDKRKAKPPLYEDFLVQLSPDGKLIKQMSFLELFKNSPSQLGILNQLRRISDGGDTPAGDMLHPNSIEIVPARIAGKAPMLKKGHIIVSFRNINILAIIDPKNEIVTWSAVIPARYHHDPRFLDDGSIMLFDNKGHLGREGKSRVIQIDLNNSAILWRYAGSEKEPLYSAFHSSVDPLPNGNVLITESLAGRLVEVSRDGEIVWDYRSPWRFKDGDIEKVPAVYRARRYKKHELTFLNDVK
jgi:hypothetical protein